MKIGIDIDDTTFLTVKSMLKYADIFEEEISGIPKNRDSFGLIQNRYYLKVLYGWDDKTKFDFFHKYYKNVLEECTMLPNANETIKKLREEGDTIHFITARLMNIENCDTEQITRNSLENFDIPYDSLNLHVSDKIQFFKKNHIDICIEDSYETCRELTDNGIKSILMTTKMNQKIDAGEIKRVNNWKEIYEEISNYKKSLLKEKGKLRKVEDLKEEYDKLQIEYGAKELDSIYNGGCEDNPDICLVFMNPTGRNVASEKSWKGRKSPWIGTKNIWKLFYKVNLLSDDIYNEILSKKPQEWDYEFADKVYQEIENHKVFITNLGKCTQVDARPLPDNVLKQYLDLLLEEIDIIKPKVIITFGNQVSSIILNKKISVSETRKQSFELNVKENSYQVFPVYYPIGNGIFNIDKSIEDINWIIQNKIKKELTI